MSAAAVKVVLGDEEALACLRTLSAYRASCSRCNTICYDKCSGYVTSMTCRGCRCNSAGRVWKPFCEMSTQSHYPSCFGATW